MHTFNVRPERGSRLSVRVEVFRDVESLQARSKTDNLRNGYRRSRVRGLIATCTGVRAYNGRRRTGLFAILRFARYRLSMSTITHEAFHATIRWAERRKISAIPTSGGRSNVVDRGPISIEERAAGVHDNLCRKLVIELERRKLIRT